MVNWSIIVADITLMRQKVVAAIHIIAMKLYEVIKIWWTDAKAPNRQIKNTAKLNSPPNKLCIRYYLGKYTNFYANQTASEQLTYICLDKSIH